MPQRDILKEDQFTQEAALKRYIHWLILTLIVSLSGCHPDPDPRVPKIIRADAPATVYTSHLYIMVEGEDDGTITGWRITTANSEPDPLKTGWFMEKPYCDLPFLGTYTLFIWAKDDENRVSQSKTVSVTYAAPVVRDWTFMIWMNGDNNLEIAAMDDFNELEYGLHLAKENDTALETKLAVVLQTDRIRNYDSASHDDGSDWTGSRRYLLKSDANSFDKDLYSQLLLDQGEVNMGDAAELADFITYTKTYFPADNYALILWNHGAGVRSSGAQGPAPRLLSLDATDEDDGLYTAEITDGLGAAHSVDLIGIDACFMGIVEGAYQYRPRGSGFEADYYVASPAMEQGDGWDYTRLLARLSGGGAGNIDPATLTPAQLATVIVEEYREFIENLTFHTEETMTALDLNQIEPVKTYLDELAIALIDYKDEAEMLRGSGITTITLEYLQQQESLYYSEGDADFINDYEWVYFPHFDLYDFAERVQDAGLSTAATNAAGLLMSAVDACVLASYTGSSYDGHTFGGSDPVDGRHGLGFFFPDGDEFYDQEGMYHYQLQWFYTKYDTNSWRAPDADGPYLYGNLDFCNSDLNGDVETWRELLEYWFDAGEDPYLDTPGNY